jgi:hypothetical protein
MDESAVAYPQIITEPIFDPYTVYPNGEMWSFCRGVDKTNGNKSSKFDSVSSYWVDIVTSKFDQDVSAMFVGPKGAGKSASVLSICYHSAVKIADWVNDGSRWDDYYNLHELTACILEDESTRLMNIQRRYVVKNFDDIGLGWGSRNWRDEDNMQKNDIFQINRTDNAIQCFSIPNQFLLDKVPRSLVSHYIEMDAKLFELGFTTIKLFKPKTMFREGKIINPFLVVNRDKFVNYLIPSPPHDLWQEYKKLRQKNKDIAIRMRSEDRVKREEQKILMEEVKTAKLIRDKVRDESAAERISQTEQIHREWDVAFRNMIPELIQFIITSGKPSDKCLNLIARKHGYEGSATAYFKRERLMQKYDIEGQVMELRK